MSTELWPANVERLRARGVRHVWRKAEHDIRLECPVCGGVLILDETRPFHWCGGIVCSAWMQTFEEVILSLPIDQVEVEK